MKFIPGGTPIVINFPAELDSNGVEYCPSITAFTEYTIEIDEKRMFPFHEWWGFTNDGQVLNIHNIGFFVEKRFIK